MFEFNTGITMGEAMEKRIASKSTDSQSEQPENIEAVNVSEDTPATEVTEPEAQVNEEVTEEVEESESEEAIETQEDDEELFVEYKGREINLKDIEDWEQGHLRQADYTRKTQELSEERKSFDADREQFNADKAEVSKLMETLRVMTEEEKLSPDELAEMREYEPEAYIKYTEKQSKREKLLNETKQLESASFDVDAERKKLWDANPTWIQDGKATKAYEEDMTSIQNYAQANGYTNNDFTHFRAQDFQTMLDAAKYQALKGKNAAIEKKVRKAPVTTKPKAATTSKVATDIKALEARVRKYGRPEDFVKLRKLKRQLTT